MTENRSSQQEHSRPTVLILTFTPFVSEPRALKQLSVLSKSYDVTTAGFGPAPEGSAHHIELEADPTPKGILKVFGSYGSKATRPHAAKPLLEGTTWDIIIAHDVLTVPLARSLKPTMGVLVDLHEYAPRQGEDSLIWRTLIGPYYSWIIRRHVSKCAEVTTVGQGIVDEYRKRFQLESTLVVNATPFRELAPTPTGETIRMVHSGIPTPARKLEIMIDAVKLTTNNVTLDLYLMPTNLDYLAQLRERAGGDPRITFQDPVPYASLIDTLHKYDIGLSMIAPTTFNLAWCLPNKFFDFIQARLGVAVGPSPEMVRFIDTYQFGVVADDFTGEALAQALNGLTPERVDALKQASHEHARELSGERQSAIWVDVVDRMVEKAKFAS